MPYSAPTPPNEVGDAVKRFIGRELIKIAQAINKPSFNELTVYNIEEALPGKPRAGTVAYFAATIAGTNEGLYRYSTGGAWVFIG